MGVALKVQNLRASVGSVEILRGVDLEIPFGQMHALMGPNGSGKSTLCHVLSGHPDFTAEGKAWVDGEEILDLGADQRARLGLVQAFQSPVAVPGVELEEIMQEAAEERGIDPDEADRRIAEASRRFDMGPFLGRSVNDDLSGGEKKRSEIFQISVLSPKAALLDETDSGLDIDMVRTVAAAVEEMRRPDMGVLMITHHSRILSYVIPDRVHVMMGGKIVTSGGPDLAQELEQSGYEGLRKRLGITSAGADTTPKPAFDFFTDHPFSS
ncbi:MAG: Fe-S cluster assembly ATPase SufC [bacterium]|nr:Fe-S cluster assembly ATPase SufC [Acidimicrobiia bacterium]MCY4650382.1 Fe-S cluster assembly ATPase SufC [bacterium]